MHLWFAKFSAVDLTVNTPHYRNRKHRKTRVIRNHSAATRKLVFHSHTRALPCCWLDSNKILERSYFLYSWFVLLVEHFSLIECSFLTARMLFVDWRWCVNKIAQKSEIVFLQKLERNGALKCRRAIVLFRQRECLHWTRKN